MKFQITEADFLQTLIDLAHLYHWKVAHFRPGLTKWGYRTAVSGDGKGFPDLVLVRPPRLLFIELKSQAEKPTAEQQEWLDSLAEVDGVLSLWAQPSDFEYLEELLR